jgi:signal transduction histidine kinase
MAGLAFIGLGASAALVVGVGVWLGVDGATALQRALVAGRDAGAGLRVTTVERDVARLGLALDRGDRLASARAADDLRSALDETLMAETTAGRLPPADLAFIAGALDRLPLIATGSTAGADPAAEAMAIADRLARIADDLRARETASAEAGQVALSRTSDRAMQMAVVLLAGALLAVAAAMARARTPRPPDPALLAVEQERMDKAFRISRARFILMMSHELRTPLNGMLGLLSVMKECDPPAALQPIIAQARRTGQQLSTMLHDMLEVESGEDRPAAPEDPAPSFQTADVATAMEDLYGPLSMQGYPHFKASVKGDTPTRLEGDGVRFQRAVSHLCSHVMETAGVEDVALEVSHDGAECRAELSFAHRAGAEAGLRLVEPAAPEAGDETTGVGLGPLLAKGLLEQLGGRLEVMTLDTGRVLVLATTPAKAMDPDIRPRVRVVARTSSIDALGAAAARSAGVRILSAEEEPAPDIVLIEAGGDDEARMLGEARARWPAAHVAALGVPDTPSAFDGIIPEPFEPAHVAHAVMDAWRRCAEETAAMPISRGALRVG